VSETSWLALDTRQGDTGTGPGVMTVVSNGMSVTVAGSGSGVVKELRE